jgi:hypothetical protein
VKGKELYIVISLYSATRWLTEYYADSEGWLIDNAPYLVFDANILYFVFDGFIIGFIGWALYTYSNKDYISKICLSLMVVMGIAQAISYMYQYMYNSYIIYLPLLVMVVTVLEAYKFIAKKQWSIDSKQYVKAKLSGLGLRFALATENNVVWIANKFKKK